MKRLFLIFALISAVITSSLFIGCVRNQDNSPAAENISASERTMSSSEISKSNETAEPVPKELVGDSLSDSTDDYDLKITGVAIADKVYPDMEAVGNSSYSFFDDVDDHSYIVITFDFHNKMNTFYEFDSPLKTCSQSLQILKNGQSYEYFADVYDPEQHGLFTSKICYSIAPLETKTFCMVFNIPDEALDTDSYCSLYWKFHKIIADGDQYTVSDDLLGYYKYTFELQHVSRLDSVQAKQ